MSESFTATLKKAVNHRPRHTREESEMPPHNPRWGRKINGIRYQNRSHQDTVRQLEEKVIFETPFNLKLKAIVEGSGQESNPLTLSILKKYRRLVRNKGLTPEPQDYHNGKLTERWLVRSGILAMEQGRAPSFYWPKKARKNDDQSYNSKSHPDQIS